MFHKISAVTLDDPHEEHDTPAVLASILRKKTTLRFPRTLAVRALPARADGDGVCA